MSSCSGRRASGKTHLALSLAVAAAEHGRRVYYGTLADLITSLEDAQTGGRLAHRLRTLVFPSLMIVDEIGYLPITRTGAMLFFQLMTRRYEHASTILTRNKGFEDVGRDLRRRGDGGGADRSARPPLPHRQHPRQQLPPAAPCGALQRRRTAPTPAAKRPSRREAAAP